MVPPLDETITSFGKGRIAKKDVGGKKIRGWASGFDSVQAARDHIRLAAAAAIRPSRRRSGAEKAQGDADRKGDESPLSTHGNHLLLPMCARDRG